MLDITALHRYKGRCLIRGDGYLYVRPAAALLPYISCYTFTFPAKSAMSDRYTIMPTASTTLVFSVDERVVAGALRGVNTKSVVVGAHANQYSFLLLIEFHPGGLYPFIHMSQNEIKDMSVPLDAIGPTLNAEISREIERHDTVSGMIGTLNRLFLSRIVRSDQNGIVKAILELVVAYKGTIGNKLLSETIHYSERHLNRLLTKEVGTGVKTLSKIVRVNHALRRMEAAGGDTNLTLVSQAAGYFDQAHFIHDFKDICGMTPSDYIRNMSVFYNDRFKL